VVALVTTVCDDQGRKGAIVYILCFMDWTGLDKVIADGYCAIGFCGGWGEGEKEEKVDVNSMA
jgi:hypothetical protein